jgi:tetratricopeptide (TPR) repeat protein
VEPFVDPGPSEDTEPTVPILSFVPVMPVMPVGPDHGGERPADGAPQSVGALRARLAADPDDAVAWRQLAAALMESDLDEAMAAATRATDLAPHDAVAHRYQAIVYVLRGEHASALPVLRTALELDPSDAEAQALVAVCLFEEGASLGQVREAADKAVAADPGNRRARRVAQAVRTAGRASWVALVGPLTAPLAVVLLGGWFYADAGTGTVGARLMLGVGLLAAAGYLPLRLAVRAFERQGVLRPPGTTEQIIASVAGGLVAAGVVALAGPPAVVWAIFGLAVAGLSFASARHLRGRLQGKS